jgi:hypothetical protein
MGVMANGAQINKKISSAVGSHSPSDVSSQCTAGIFSLETILRSVKMISHIEKPILEKELARIYASNKMMESEQNLVHSIIQQINQNKNCIEIDQDDRYALINILTKHRDYPEAH